MTVTETKTTYEIAPAPTHPNIIQVHRIPGFFNNYSTSLVDLPAGSLFAKMEGITNATEATWSSVQRGRNKHFELNSDIVYMNHSCAPTVEFDTSRMEVRVARNRDLKKGDQLTFFYPSSEWKMTQSFECKCGEPECVGLITGAGEMMPKQMKGYWLNNHIVEMLQEQEQADKESRL